MFQKIKDDLKKKREANEANNLTEAQRAQQEIEDKKMEAIRVLAQKFGYNGNFPPGLSSGTSSWMQRGLFPALTVEEAKELEELEKERLRRTKQVKLDHFKKLDRSLRQHVINNTLWNREMNVINNTQASPTERQKELTIKKSNSNHNKYMGSPYHGVGVLSGSGTSMQDFGDRVNINYLPKDITLEDLMQAHAEACLEEELSGV